MLPFGLCGNIESLCCFLSCGGEQQMGSVGRASGPSQDGPVTTQSTSLSGQRKEKPMEESIPTSATVPQGAAESASIATTQLTPTQRWISLAEFLVAAAIVIGHNVYHVIPNEVPILFVLGLISVRLRDGGWAAMGLRWPLSWRQTILLALGAAALRMLLGALVIGPITAHFWPAANGPSGSDEITGHVMVALRWLLLIWTF